MDVLQWLMAGHPAIRWQVRRDHLTHFEGGQRFFDGEVEACINRRVVAAGAYFGHDLGERRGAPSRWVTLRALRVLRWAGEGV